MTRTAAILLSIALTSPAWSQESGFYIGGDISAFDSDFDNLAVTGDGTAFGLHAGYRHMLDGSFFLEGEVFAAILDGDTNTGNTEFDDYYGLTLGAGTYFTPEFYGLVFGGIAVVGSTNVTTGSESDSGPVLGLGLGYDITPQHSIGLRYSHVSVDGDFGDVDSDIFGIRYSYRF